MKYTINRRTFELKRRTLLRSTTFGIGTVMGLPLLEAMFKTDAAYAQAATGTPRFFGMYTPNGVYHEPGQNGLWFPKWDGEPAGEFDVRPITNMQDSALRKFDEFGLNDEITIIQGLQNDCNATNSTGNNHLTGIASWLTGHGIHPHGNLRDGDMATKHRMSMEQEVSNFANQLLNPGTADKDLPNPDNMALRMAGSSHLDGGRMDYNNAMKNGLNWSKNGQILSLDGDLRKQFNTIYSKPGMTGGQNGGGTVGIDRRTRLKISVMDDVRAQLQSLQKRLGAADMEKVQSYLDNVRDIERSLDEMGTPMASTCNPVEKPLQDSEVPDYKFGGGAKLGNNKGAPHIGEHMKVAAKITAHAFSCGLIHSASYCCGGEAAGALYKDIGVNQHFHNSISHNRGKKNEWMKIDRQHSDNMALFMKEMKDIKVAGGDMLDNTAIMFGSGLGDGSKHAANRIAFLVGGRFGKWKHGRHFKFRSTADKGAAKGKDTSHALIVNSIRKELGMDMDTIRQPHDTNKLKAGQLLNKGTFDFT